MGLHNWLHRFFSITSHSGMGTEPSMPHFLNLIGFQFAHFPFTVKGTKNMKEEEIFILIPLYSRKYLLETGNIC